MRFGLLAALFALVALFAAIGYTGADAAEKPAVMAVGDEGVILFEKTLPRESGERECYIVLTHEDKAMTEAIANAINGTRIKAGAFAIQISGATALSGNLVFVPIPQLCQRDAAGFADVISAVKFSKPEKRIPEDAITTEALEFLCRGCDDQNVQMSAMIALARRNSLQAYKILNDAFENNTGWRKRCASYAMYLYGRENEKTLEQHRREFLKAYSDLGSLLKRNPNLQKYTQEEMEAFKQAVAKLSASAPPGVPSAGVQSSDKYQRMLKVIKETIAITGRCYAGEEKVSEDELIKEVIKGLGEYLDKYSAVFDKETKERWDKHMKSEFVGIGVTIEISDDGDFIVVSPIFGSPAYNAGFKARDIIRTVDGESVKGIEMQDLRTRITGEKGTVVRIGILRKGWKAPKEFPIVRAKITMPVVLYKMMPGKIGYLRLLQFATNSHEEFAKALKALNAQGMKALIIDLRNNPGGGLKQTLTIANQFIPAGRKLSSMKGRPGTQWAGRDFMSWPARKQPGYPVMMLINGASASGSEMLTGALKYNNRATVIGQKTFGKGCGQTVFTLKSSPNWFLKLTVFNYYLPNDECINGTGIEPHIPLEKEEHPEWITDAIGELDLAIVDDYVDSLYAKDKELCEHLAGSDGFDAGKYPGFDNLYKKLDTELDKEIIRRLLRERVRRAVAGAAAKPFTNDLQEDKELQRAMYEAFKKLNADPKSVKDFKRYAERIEKELADSAAKDKKSEKKAEK